MTLLWCDGFDHYGTTGNLTEGAWAELSGTTSISSVNPRTGTYNMRDTGGARSGLTRRVLGGAKTTVGIGGSFYFNNLPTSNDVLCPFVFNDAANANQITIVIQSTGVIEAKRGSRTGTSLGSSGSPVIVAEAYQHIECMVTFSQTVGTVEVRVNGVTVLSVTGVDTVATSLVECSQIVLFSSSTSGIGSNPTTSIDVDDLFCYDDNGSYNNTFVGDRRVLTLFPNADTAQADWTVVGAANGYSAISEVPPDADTSYITAAEPGSPGSISEFDLDDLPGGVSAISAVYVVNMSRKTEAGTADLLMSIVSGSNESPGDVQQMTEIYTYRGDVFEVDPATAAPFTPSAVDSMQLKIERTS